LDDGLFFIRRLAAGAAAELRGQLAPRLAPLPSGQRAGRDVQAARRAAARGNVLLDEPYGRFPSTMFLLAPRLLLGCLLLDAGRAYFFDYRR
jgi:hypothetical protein